jgi:hypothetical protein
MNTKTSKWMQRLAGVTTLLMVSTSFVGQASARILFQDDTVGVWESDQLQVGSNDAGAVNTSIKFGADVTEAENALINWNITTNTLEIKAADNSATSVAITGGLSATGQVNFSGAAGMRLRESANPNTLAACSTLNEVIMNTSSNALMVCTTTGIAGVAVWTAPAPSVPTGTPNPLTCSPGQLFFNTTTSTLQVCTAANTWNTAGPQDFESLFAYDADKTLTTGGTNFTINSGAGNTVIDSNLWNVTAGGALDAATVTSNGLLTGLAGATVSGAAISLNNNSNFAVNIGTGTTTSAVSIGGGANQVAINSSTWDISGAGAASGLTGLVSTGTVDFSGAGAFRTREVAGITNPGTACTTTGELIMDTNDNTLYVCTNAGTDAWSKVASGGDATTLDGIDSTQFLRSDTSDNFTSGTLTFDNGTTLTVNGVANLGDGGDAITVNTNTWDISGAGVASGFTGLTTGGIVSLGDNTGTVTINSSDWDISATGAMTGISGITNDAAFTTSGGAVSVNNNSNFATDINTGTSTGAVSIGGGSNTVTINSSTWDISGAGAASGFTTIDASGNITTSGGTFCIGTTCLNETTSATDSGAYVIGVFDEFDNSNSTTVQGVLNDLDAKIGSNAPNVEILTFYPEYPDTVVWRDGTTNAGTLTSNYDDANDEHFYRWTSNNATTQDIDLKFRFAIPADFASTGDFTYRFRTGTATEADNDVEMYFYNATDAMALCGSDTTNGTAGVWATGTITAATLNAGCAGLSAGDIIEIDVKLMDNSGGADYADVGYVSLAYNN